MSHRYGAPAIAILGWQTAFRNNKTNWVNKVSMPKFFRKYKKKSI